MISVAGALLWIVLWYNNPIIRAPALLIMGEMDYFTKFPGMEDYKRSGILK
ncbi:hypothetical protein SLEP1_g44843 [Rubroshorea leprosula]|uniref:Uncharacterized protein n=1 Tax=Rubroshorea leprosula TaxID=152421 RepID=A0AAV5LIT9_9ROSI|nr:hypothetical protein SLEP1_g44843 [Rubroshorea leprosula]